MRRANTFADKLLASLTAGLLLLITGSASLADAPTLPKGLSSGPSESGADPSAPALPPGLVIGDEGSLTQSDRIYGSGSSPAEFGGFFEARLGFRTQDDPHQADSSVREVRIQLGLQKDWDVVSLRTVTDFRLPGGR